MCIRSPLRVVFAGLVSLGLFTVAHADSQFYLIAQPDNQAAAADPEGTGRIKVKLAGAATTMQHDTLKAIIQNMSASAAPRHNTSKAAINNVRYSQNGSAEQRTTPNTSFGSVVRRGASKATSASEMTLRDLAAETQTTTDYVIEGRDDSTGTVFMTMRLSGARIVAADEGSRRGLGESIVVAGGDSGEMYRVYYESMVLEYSPAENEASDVHLDLRLGITDEN